MPADFSAGAILKIRITPADVGKRVSVRQLVAITDGHHTFTDTVGVLASWDDGVVCVTRRNGQTVRIPQEALVAGKVVPPAPARRAGRVPAVTARELEERAARAWPATRTEPLGDWTLRAAGGFTRRANSALAVGDPGLPPDEALAAVAAWYGERGLPPLVQLPDGSPYATALADRGWTAEADTVVRTAPLAPLTALPAEGVELTRTPPEDWLRAYHRAPEGEGEGFEEALKVVTGGPSVWFASAPGAIGRAVVDGPWALFGAVEVEPALRRRGLATAVMGALARRAADEGATAAYLQVEADNEGARALYDRLGFGDHHHYRYWRPAA